LSVKFRRNGKNSLTP